MSECSTCICYRLIHNFWTVWRSVWTVFKLSTLFLSCLDRFKAIQTIYFLRLCWTLCWHVWPTLVCKDAIKATWQQTMMPWRAQWARMALKVWSGFDRHTILNWSSFVLSKQTVLKWSGRPWTTLKPLAFAYGFQNGSAGFKTIWPALKQSGLFQSCWMALKQVKFQISS